MGSLLRLPVHEVGAATDAWDALEAAGFRHLLAEARGGAAPDEADWSGRVALWLFLRARRGPPPSWARVARGPAR